MRNRIIQVYVHPVATPVGPLTMVAEGDAISGCYWDPNDKRIGAACQHDAASDALLKEATRQLHSYFAGRLRAFDLPLAPHGSAFQIRVWDALQTISYGEVVSYTAIARAIGAPTAVRAVGTANGRNPLSIFIPCHRVIGEDGSLRGYAGGLQAKAWLLDRERSGNLVRQSNLGPP
ncbi:MAG: methylated-DNA--[protein]-cysteine S-methyltransferase [Polyangiaceae bacterium]|nr:methylated-DNA--[protein]-cysteine S-methyltransferase [Polyangiaceae bacterium]